MKIAYLCFDFGIPVLGDKGASVHVREMIAALARAGHDVTLLCARTGSGNPAPPGTTIEITPRARASGDHNRPRDTERARIEFDADLPTRAEDALGRAEVEPDAIYERFSLFSRAGIALAARRRIAHVLEVNAPLVDEQERYRNLQLKDEALAHERATLMGTDHVIAISNEVAAYVAARGVSNERITVLPNGVDTTRFAPGRRGDGVRARHELGHLPVIGFVGSLKAWHGIDLLLEAFPLIRARVPEAVLLIVGDGPEFARLRTAVFELGQEQNVIMTGRVPHDEVPAYLCAMDVSVAPYRPDDHFYFSPMKVVESLACGTPVVAPRLGQLEKLLHDGAIGMLYRAGDATALAAAVIDLLSDRERLRLMGLAASTLTPTDHSWDANARDVVHLMRRARRAVTVS